MVLGKPGQIGFGEQKGRRTPIVENKAVFFVNQDHLKRTGFERIILKLIFTGGFKAHAEYMPEGPAGLGMI